MVHNVHTDENVGGLVLDVVMTEVLSTLGRNTAGAEPR